MLGVDAINDNVQGLTGSSSSESPFLPLPVMGV